MLARAEKTFSFNHDIDWEQAQNPNIMTNKTLTEDSRVSRNAEHRKDVAGEGPDHFAHDERTGRAAGRDTIMVGNGKEILVAPGIKEQTRHRISNASQNGSPKRSRSRTTEDLGNADLPPYQTLNRKTTAQLGLPQLSQLPALPHTDDTDIGGPPLLHATAQENAERVNPLVADMKRPMVDRDCMRDPLNDSFYLDTWHAVAENNTKLFRTVFRCMPDNEVKSWKEYKEYAAYADRFWQSQGGGKSKDRVQQEVPGSSGPPGQGSTGDKLRMLGSVGEKIGDTESRLETLGEKLVHTFSHKDHNRSGNQPLGKVEDWAEDAKRANAIRNAKDSESNGGLVAAANRQPLPKSSSMDEKVATSIDGLKEFTPLKPSTTLDSDALRQKETPPTVSYSEALNNNNNNSSNTTQKRRRRATLRNSKREFRASDDLLGRTDAEDLMKMAQGHLVIWPYEWYVEFLIWLYG